MLDFTFQKIGWNSHTSNIKYGIKYRKWEEKPSNRKKIIGKQISQGHFALFQGFRQKIIYFQGFQGPTFIFQAFQGF